MQDLRITLVQTELAWEDKPANLQNFDTVLKPLKGETDLILLPEMFTTGFSMQPELFAEEMHGSSVSWMQEKAYTLDAAICGSIIIKEGEEYFNRLIWATPDGVLKTYDKRHLFTLAGEKKHYTAGYERLIVECKGWKICPQVCYDLRFPVWARNNLDYDLLLYIANWPERRNTAWKSLLQARAIENQSYLAAVNRIGDDGNGIYHSGNSCLIDPLGEVIYTESDATFVKTFSLNKERLNYVREKFAFLPDQDDFTIHT